MVGPGETETDLAGTVVRAGTQALLADVSVTLGGRTVQSSDRGQYRFEEVPVGEVTLSASFAGYLPYERILDIEQGANRWDIALIPDN